MSEDKLKRSKKTNEDNIYSINLDFDDEMQENKSKKLEKTEKVVEVEDIEKDEELEEPEKFVGDENINKLSEEKDETDDEELDRLVDRFYESEDEIEETDVPKKRKNLARIEEGIKSSKVGVKRSERMPKAPKSPKETKKTTKRASKKGTKSATHKQSEIKMHTEDNLTEIKLKQNDYRVELQKTEYDIYTESNETSYIIVREPSLRIVAGTAYILLDKQGEEYSITTNQDFKINYVIDNLERKNNVVNFKLTNLTQIEANADGLVFEIDEEKIIENNLEDNKTLVISEEDGMVYLPYTKEDIKNEVIHNKGVKIGDVIEDKYTIPLNKYKNSMRARFREGYNLMYKKEHKSRKSAFMLGLELMFESNLHPAIISACKNLEELDIYLDCLEDNELEKFSCFKIIYKSLPTLKKVSKGKMEEI